MPLFASTLGLTASSELHDGAVPTKMVNTFVGQPLPDIRLVAAF